MLRAADGGYDPEIGWDGKAKQTVETLPQDRHDPVQDIESDTLTETGSPEELLRHLEKVADEAARLGDALGLSGWLEVLRWAGALHDLGKAHPVFQLTLRHAIYGDDDAGGDGRLWAKSGKSGGRHTRHYFRHELASALAVRGLDGRLEVPQRELTSYLVATHHGKVRLSIRPAPNERRPADADAGARFALGIVDGDVLPEVRTPVGTVPEFTLDLAVMELGAEDSWADSALRLRDDPDLGPFRLGLLEALLRIADWRASGA